MDFTYIEDYGVLSALVDEAIRLVQASNARHSVLALFVRTSGRRNHRVMQDRDHAVRWLVLLKEDSMNVDSEKIDEMVLALLYLTSFKEGDGVRAWKGHSWEAMNRLFEKGMIGDPKSKAKSVWLTDEGAKRSEELFRKFFEKPA